MKKSDKNLAVIQNFILHVTHSSNDESDVRFKELMTFTPEQLYQMALDYIEEDHVDGEGNPEDFEQKDYPNGFTSWNETHYEVVQSITMEITMEIVKDVPTGTVAKRHEAQGHGGLYELAEELTDKFEKLNRGKQWDGEFFDEIDKFTKEELFPEK